MSSSRNPGRLFVEFLVVLISILAAFGVEEFRENRAEAELRSVALTNIRAEVQHNRDALANAVDYHRSIVEAAQGMMSDPGAWEGQRGFEAAGMIAPRGIQPPTLRDTAWETARLSGALSLIDFELSQRIAETYHAKELGVDATIVRLADHVFTISTFRTDDTEASVMLIAALAGELLAQEIQLGESLDLLLADFP